jgi:DNA polymerase-3 subunit epsilon
MENRHIVLDTETTGLEVEKGHRIIEIGGVVMIGRKKTSEKFHVYINPQREIDKEAQAVHGISNEDLQDKPIFSEIAEDLLEFIDGSTLVIHNADFDVGFLDAEFRIASSTYPSISDICEIKDTLAIARNKFPGQRNSLDALSKRFEINGYDRSFHGALLDANILADVYSNLTGGQSKINFVNKFEADSKKEDKNQKSNLLNNLEITKIVTSEEDELMHSKRLKEIEEKIGKKVLWDQ